MMATLRSLNVGMPKDVDWHGRTVHTGIWKAPVDGPRMVRRLNIDGDGQGDLNGHGGEMRAVLVYELDSYDYWQRHFGRDDFSYGQFGENFTVDGLPDDEVCVGDRYRIGEAEFEVTQPRVTCYRVGMRMGEPELPSLLVAHRRPGFYLRVIKEGRVQAGDEIVRTRVGPEELSVADIDALLYLPDRDEAKLRASLNIPALSPGWQQSFRELVEALETGTPTADGRNASPYSEPQPGPSSGAAEVDGQAAGVVADWPGFRPLTVSAVTRESDTVRSIYLESADGEPLPAARPGQFLVIRFGDQGIRSYSLSSAPGSSTYRISVKREGVVSTYIHEHLTAGMTVEAAAPRGEFVLTEEPGPVVLVSAGIGITPVMAMLHRLADERSRRSVWWIHIARSPEQQAFATEAAGLIGSLTDVHPQVFFTAGGHRPGREQLARLGIPRGASAYVCGPAGFMEEMRVLLTDLGVSEVRTELFGALPSINPGLTDAREVQPHPPVGEPGTGPLITFSRSGLSVPWSDQHSSLLELADACDVPTRWSCRTGVCHTCVTPLISGEVSYRPQPLEPPAVGEVLPCCARPTGDLVLDL
ncbi:MOSC and FAD-binding oxidoreductase domain-containing protein [Kribbella sp. VKM Ac-2568]|uniref:MOSC and FAD-binding oxidoreductase domain-containing protein n=1 Tax=Kribbella sp. VKM Ac-2568 TaxID=2512219 RepID=UPI0010EE8CA0|nr:MOSC and FAD-binding oxidoreductase domain-containing protein [Kribbella sp. VKM Ac-2568]TCM48781.1 ferredoxin-NADP reductase [Kribbella sp. VKM Ac-2568]